MSYELGVAQKVAYTPIDFGALTPVDESLILTGSDCIGSAADQFSDSGIQVHNKPGRLLLVFKNDSEALNAYARVQTTKKIQTLDFPDLTFLIPPGATYAVGGFTNFFQIKDTLTEEPFPGVTVQREYSDFVRINFSHDSVSEPTISFGAFYV